MSTSSDQHSPAGARAAGQPSTQEIPVVPAAQPASPPAPARPVTGGAHLPPPGTAAPQPQNPPPVPMQPTGPVDFVPGLPGAGTLPPPPPGAAAVPAAEPGPEAPPTTPVSAAGDAPGWPESLESEPAPAPARKRIVGKRPADRRAALGLGLAALAVALLELGLLLRFGTERLWSTVTLWSAFATLSAVLALVAFAAFYPAANRLRSGAVWRIAAAGLVGLSVFWVLVVLPVVASDRGFVLTAALACLGAALWIGPRRKD